jgi:hypothetical protein
MDLNTTLEHLELARQHIAQSERHIAYQREIIDERERDGHDAAKPRQLLYQMEELYKLQIADRDRLEKELAYLSK